MKAHRAQRTHPNAEGSGPVEHVYSTIVLIRVLPVVVPGLQFLIARLCDLDSVGSAGPEGDAANPAIKFDSRKIRTGLLRPKKTL